MRNVLRNGLVVSLGVTASMAACGSDDDSKKEPPGYQAGGESGSAGSAADGEGGGNTSSEGGDDVGGNAGSGATGEGGANGGAAASGAAGGASAGAAGSGAAGGEAEVCAEEPPPSTCAAGTADCDDDPNDCETDIAADESNCGRCDRACGGTAQCAQGLCGATVVLDPNVDSNWCGAAFTDTTAYMITCWGNSDLSEVRSAPLEPGGSVVGTSIKSYNNVSVVALRGIVIDGNDVLFGLQESPSHLYKFPLDAAGPADVTVGYTFENNQRFDDLKLIGDTFWWNHNTHTVPGNVQPSTIEKRTKAAASSTVVVSGLGQSYNLQVFEQHLIWLELRTQGGTVSVYRAPLAGGTAVETELIAPATAGAYLRRQGDYAYWTHKAAAPNGKLVRFETDNPDAEPQDVATGLNLPEGLVTDAKYAYFKQLDALYRVPLCGGTPEQLSPVVPAHDAQATAIYHVDDNYVYFAADPGFGTSTLVRVAK
jgi:hypothetical protein